MLSVSLCHSTMSHITWRSVRRGSAGLRGCRMKSSRPWPSLSYAQNEHALSQFAELRPSWAGMVSVGEQRRTAMPPAAASSSPLRRRADGERACGGGGAEGVSVLLCDSVGFAAASVAADSEDVRSRSRLGFAVGEVAIGSGVLRRGRCGLLGGRVRGW
jgi:hypothetical protein